MTVVEATTDPTEVIGDEAADERPTVELIAESMSGFDEIAIEQKFGRDVSELSGPRSLRAMVFTIHRRAGMTDKDAFKAAMQAPLKDIMGAFADKPDADDEDDDEGKDD